FRQATEYVLAGLCDDLPGAQTGVQAVWGTLLGWLFVHALGKVLDGAEFEQISRSWSEEWLLGRIIAGCLQGLGLDEGAAWRAVATIHLLISHQRWFEVQGPEQPSAHAAGEYPRVLERWLNDDEVQRFVQVNRYRGVLWFNKESFEQLLWWMLAVAVVGISADPLRPGAQVAQDIVAAFDVVRRLQSAEEQSGYQVERLLEAATFPKVPNFREG
ncbi:MAG TPA: hypothetical protein VMY80_16935, partial [Anaerolineae bacterium]|nr:hypothetical protein [Anaerolineae bacterium]